MDTLETGYLVTPWAVTPKKGKPQQYMLVPVVFLDDLRWRVSGPDVAIRDWDEIAFATKRPGPLTPEDCCFIVTGRIPKASAKKLPETYLAAASIMREIRRIQRTGQAVLLQTKEQDFLWPRMSDLRTKPTVQPRHMIRDIITDIGLQPQIHLITLIGNVYEV
jgi:hypothetical protein